MFTMDDWLGLVILMVCIASAIALIVMFAVGCAKLGCWLSDRVARRSPPTLREGAELAMLKTDPSVIETRRFTEAKVCAAFGVVPPAESLDSIIRDLHSAITDEHLEIRSHNRFSAILTRLEDYRAQTRS